MEIINPDILENDFEDIITFCLDLEACQIIGCVALGGAGVPTACNKWAQCG